MSQGKVFLCFIVLVVLLCQAKHIIAQNETSVNTFTTNILPNTTTTHDSISSTKLTTATKRDYVIDISNKSSLYTDSDNGHDGGSESIDLEASNRTKTDQGTIDNSTVTTNFGMNDTGAVEELDNKSNKSMIEKEEGTEDNNNTNSDEETKGGDEDEEESEEGYFEEERCTFNQFLSGLNISHYLPEDKSSLREELNTFGDTPERIRISPSVNYTIERLKRLLNLASSITSRQELRSGFASFVQHNYDLFLELELDAPCMTSIISIIAAIRRSELWAIKFVDSIAKPPPGLLSGQTSFLGDFDQCLSVKSPESASEEFSGQYCLLRPILPLPDIRKYNGDADESLIGETKVLNYLASYQVDRYVQTNPVLKFIEHMKSQNGRVLNFAICFPNLCSPKQLEKSFNRRIPFEIQESSCWTLAKTKDVSVYMNQYTKMAIFVLTIMSTIVLLSTFYELYSIHILKRNILDQSFVKPKVLKTINMLVCIFSARSNTKILMTRSPSRFAPLDTLRLILVLLMGLTHSFYNTPLSSGLRKLSQSVPYELLSNPKYFFIRAPSLLNDGLLVIAGALFVRSVFRQMNLPHDNFSHLLFLLRRWFRLTMPFFGSILFLLVLPLTGYGPLWDRMVDIVLPPCQSPSSLVSSLFYYSNWNFVKSNHSNSDAFAVCNPDTWFLSIIFQLNVAFFLLAVFIYQSPRNGLRLLTFFIVSSLFLNISPRIFHSNTRTYYELTKQPSLWHLRRNYYLYHQNIIQYVGAFCVGLLLGYAIVVNEHQKQQNNSTVNRKIFVYNCVSFGTIVTLFVWINQFFVQNTSPSEISVLLFFSFGRVAFALAFSWIIYVSVSNKSESITAILSAPLLLPFGRLSFCIFLVQNLVQYYRMYSVKETYVMTFAGTIENFIIDSMISSILGYLLYILFEGPSQRLNELFCGATDHLNNQKENNKAYMFERQINGNKMKASSINGADSYPSKASFESTQTTESVAINSLTHRSKALENQQQTQGINTEVEMDNGIISIRF